MRLNQIIRVAAPRKYQSSSSTIIEHLAFLADALAREQPPYYVDVVGWHPILSGSRASYLNAGEAVGAVLAQYMLPYKVSDVWPVVSRSVQIKSGSDTYIICTHLRLVLTDIGIDDLLRGT